MPITFYDSYGNFTTPTPSFLIHIANAVEKRKLVDAIPTEHGISWGSSGSGEATLSFVPRSAGAQELHIWGDPNGTGERVAFPGSPFYVFVRSGQPTATESFVDGWTKEARGAQEHHGPGSSKQKVVEKMDVVVAGDVVLMRPSIHDSFGNLTALPEGALRAKAMAPDGSSTPLTINKQNKTMKHEDVTLYDMKHEVTLSGSHHVDVTLSGVPIKGSPVTFDVLPAAPDPHMCRLVPPARIDSLVADYDKPTTSVIKTFDKYGNACLSGGLLIGARLQLVKQGSNDLTILMPNNHSVTVEDKNDGTYEVMAPAALAHSAQTPAALCAHYTLANCAHAHCSILAPAIR